MGAKHQVELKVPFSEEAGFQFEFDYSKADPFAHNYALQHLREKFPDNHCTLLDYVEFYADGLTRFADFWENIEETMRDEIQGVFICAKCRLSISVSVNAEEVTCQECGARYMRSPSSLRAD